MRIAAGLIALNSLTVRTKATQSVTQTARSRCSSTVDRRGHPPEERFEVSSGPIVPLAPRRRSPF